MSTTGINLSAQELSNLYAEIYCTSAILALLVYDWLLCLDKEIKFIWNWHSRRVTISSLVYALSRYSMLVQFLLIILTIYPMSNSSCTANTWIQTAMQILGLVAFSTFSALRAYALSNRSICLVTMIILSALPPTVMHIVEPFYENTENLPSPLNCSHSGPVSTNIFLSVYSVTRGSQLAAELLVVTITWWYTYQSYRIQRGVKLGRTIGSVLFYNGSIYFLCLATLYILDIILNTSPLTVQVIQAASFYDVFIDPITSILTCRFMLSLRQFDSTITCATYSGHGLGRHGVQEHMASTALEFGAQPSDSLPAVIASFAHPVHLDAALFEAEPDNIVGGGSDGPDINIVAAAPGVTEA